MANQKIFCSAAWTNTHIYWNGQYGGCCSELIPIIGDTYNLKFHSLDEWRSSSTMKNFRQRLIGNDPLPECSSCYYEEQHGHESRRIKENFKTAIFTESAFERSYEQSSWYKHFENNIDSDARDWHIDFGNECNLACKMCFPAASSRVAHHHRQWGILDTKFDNWTNNESSWNQFLQNIDNGTKIHRIHVMGGEPMISKRYVEFVQYLVDQGRTDISMSFVSNGTIINHDLIKLLKNFKEVNIEISLESINDNNHYIRQGSNTSQVISNINWLGANTFFQIVLRSVPQLLSVNNYDQYIQWAFDRRLSIQSIPLTRPAYLGILVLPLDIRLRFVAQYQKVKDYLELNNPTKVKTISTGRDVSRLAQQLTRECDMIINQLSLPEPDNVNELRCTLVEWLHRWDKEFDLDARKFYPEYQDFLTEYGYNV